MNYLSVCSGIEAATVAWHHMGWQPTAFSEIEKFPSEVLSHHYPDVPNLGDMTKFKEWNLNETIGLLVGGTPCQSFSVAGLRKGLEDPRGNLALVYCAILDKFKPKWFLWENVPGVLSSNGGRDFGSFLGAVAELGYGFAYRVLDAQYFGVAQRRRRVFVVGHLGDWRPAAKVLFERESLRRDTAPSRSKREEVTARAGIGPEISGPLAARRFAETDGLSTTSAQMIAVPENKVGALLARDYKGVDSYDHSKVIPMIASGKDQVGTLSASHGQKQFLGNQEAFSGDYHVLEPIALAENTIGRQPQNGGNGDGFTEGGPMYTLNATGVHGVACIGGQHPNAATDEELSPTLTNAMGAGGGHVPIINDAVAFQQNTRDEVRYINGDGQIAGALMAEPGMKQQNYVMQSYGFEPGIAKREGDPNRFVEEMTPTLRADMGDNQTAVAFSFDSLASNSMKSKNPNSGCRQVELSKTLDTSSPCPSKNQGGIAIVAPTLTTNDPSRSPQATEVTNQIAAVFEATIQNQKSTPIISWDSELNPNVDKMGTLMRGGQGGRMDGVMHNMAVRRLTPVECERLQGFPDYYTDIKPKDKPTPDGARYKALGNSMAVPVMRWIGERINKIEKGEL